MLLISEAFNVPVFAIPIKAMPARAKGQRLAELVLRLPVLATRQAFGQRYLKRPTPIDLGLGQLALTTGHGRSSFTGAVGTSWVRRLDPKRSGGDSALGLQGGFGEAADVDPRRKSALPFDLIEKCGMKSAEVGHWGASPAQMEPEASQEQTKNVKGLMSGYARTWRARHKGGRAEPYCNSLARSRTSAADKL